MDPAIEDGVGDRRVAQIRVPLSARQLTRDDRRARGVAILHDLEEILTLHIGHGGEAPVIKDQDVHARHAAMGFAMRAHKTALVVSGSRLNPSPQLSFEPSYTANWVDLVQGSFTTHLLGTRVTYTMTPLIFTSALVQYNSSTNGLSANVRLRWEYQPGSELFVVYNEERNTLGRGFPDLLNRALVVKVSRLIRL